MQNNLGELSSELKKGSLVLSPYSGSWGFLVALDNKERIQELVNLKQTEAWVLISSDAMLNKTVEDIPELAWDIIDESEEVPLLKLKASKLIAQELRGEHGLIQIYFDKTPHTNNLISKFGRALAYFRILNESQKSLEFENINDEMKQMADFINKGTESKVKNQVPPLIQLGMNGEIQILRY